MEPKRFVIMLFLAFFIATTFLQAAEIPTLAAPAMPTNQGFNDLYVWYRAGDTISWYAGTAPLTYTVNSQFYKGMILWYYSPGGLVYQIGEVVDVSWGYPAMFLVRLYNPPKDMGFWYTCYKRCY